MRHLPVGDSFIDPEKTVSYYDVVLPLYRVTQTGEPIKLEGTCFPIGRNIYLTAAHIFDGFKKARQKYQQMPPEKTAPTPEEMEDRLKWMRIENFLDGADVNTGALVIDQSAIRRGKLETKGFSFVTGVIMALDFDLAVLFVEDDKRRNPDGHEQPIACLSLIENPRVGQKIAIAGFPGEKNVLKVTEEGGKPKYSFGLSLVVSEGKITEMHPVMRDVGQAFYPCFQTSAPTLPGHSGGPAICLETLSVVGLNSIGATEGGLVSWIGKAFDAELTTPVGLTVGGKDVTRGQATTLRKLSEAGLIEIYES